MCVRGTCAPLLARNLGNCDTCRRAITFRIRYLKFVTQDYVASMYILNLLLLQITSIRLCIFFLICIRISFSQIQD